MKEQVSTSRLLLDLLTTADHEFMMSLVNTKGWIKFIGDRNVHSKEEALAYIDKILNTTNLYYWVVRIREENTAAGIISFVKRRYLEHYDIGFAFLPEFCGRGYAYEAASQVLQVARENPEHQTVLATTIPGNIKSVKLLNKLGFHFEREIEVENDKLCVYTNKAPD